MNIIAIIPARGGSKEIPQKNIIDFAGKPLIAWTIEQAKSSNLIYDVYVSSDSQEILTVASNYGAKPILRPKAISGDKSSSESALLHALNQIRKEPDLVVFLQATSPIRKKDDIDNAINKFIDEGADSLFSSRKIEGFIWREHNKRISPVNYDYMNRPMRQEIKNYYKEENGSIYIFKPRILLEMNARLGKKIIDYPMDMLCSIQIDYPEDIKLAESILNYEKTIYNNETA